MPLVLTWENFLFAASLAILTANIKGQFRFCDLSVWTNPKGVFTLNENKGEKRYILLRMFEENLTCSSAITNHNVCFLFGFIRCEWTLTRLWFGISTSLNRINDGLIAVIPRTGSAHLIVKSRTRSYKANTSIAYTDSTVNPCFTHFNWYKCKSRFREVLERLCGRFCVTCSSRGWFLVSLMTEYSTKSSSKFSRLFLCFKLIFELDPVSIIMKCNATISLQEKTLNLNSMLQSTGKFLPLIVSVSDTEHSGCSGVI